MADGLNEARAMRIAEVLSEFHVIQRRLSQFQANPPPEEYHEPGYVVLRQCTAEGLAVLSSQFNAESSQISRASEEQKKQQLQRILLDASARRFQAQQIYLRATAASRWINTRYSILQGQRSQTIHTAALQQTNNVLQAELAAIQDDRIVCELRRADSLKGYWLAEDPPLARLLSWIRTRS